jgi:hypothetical protein
VFIFLFMFMCFGDRFLLTIGRCTSSDFGGYISLVDRDLEIATSDSRVRNEQGVGEN